MLLFGIYFPERLNFDRRFPFLKWIMIVPLAVAGIANLFEQIGKLFGWRWRTKKPREDCSWRG